MLRSVWVGRIIESIIMENDMWSTDTHIIMFITSEISNAIHNPGHNIWPNDEKLQFLIFDPEILMTIIFNESS